MNVCFLCKTENGNIPIKSEVADDLIITVDICRTCADTYQWNEVNQKSIRKFDKE